MELLFVAMTELFAFRLATVDLNSARNFCSSFIFVEGFKFIEIVAPNALPSNSPCTPKQPSVNTRLVPMPQLTSFNVTVSDASDCSWVVPPPSHSHASARFVVVPPSNPIIVLGPGPSDRPKRICAVLCRLAILRQFSARRFLLVDNFSTSVRNGPSCS